MSAGTFGCNFRCLFCFPPGTLVLTEKGIQPIENIQKEIPLKVFTHSGKLKEIKKLFSHPYNGEIIKIKPYYGFPITCTPSHSFFTTLNPKNKKIEKIAAKELTLNHYLVIPKKFSFFKKITFDLYQILSPFQKEYQKSRKTSPEDISKILRLTAAGVPSKKIGEIFNLHPAYVRTLRSRLKKIEINNHTLIWGKNLIVEKNQKIKFKTEKTPYIPRYLDLTPQLAKLLGFYCAEGWVSKSSNRPNSWRLIFSFGKKEKNYVEEVTQLIFKIFGIRPKIVERKTTNTIELGKSSVALFFKILCGSGAKNKMIPPALFNAPPMIVKAFLEGYVNGDGWVKNNEVVVNTASQNLALGIYWLVLKIGFLPKFYLWQPSPNTKIEGKEVKQSSLYYVKWKTKIEIDQRFPQRNVKYKKDRNYFFIPIKEIKKEYYQGDVYNLEVEDDHSYIANFLAVGNCQNWEISWADGVAEAQHGQKISPQQLVDLAYKYGSAGIAITYNEPAIWLEYSLEVFKKIRNSQSVIRNYLYTVWVTNGYATPEAIDLIAPYLNIYRVDLKSFDDKFYQKLINVPRALPIFETTKYLHDKYPHIHIECVTNIIPGWNDAPEMLAKIAHWIVKNLGGKTSWHVTRFFPYAKLTNVPPTPPETLYKAREIGLKAGLKLSLIHI